MEGLTSFRCGDWMEGLHARIRDFVKDRYVESARARGASEFTLRAGDVHEAMGLKARMPAVCAVLGSGLFIQGSRLLLIRRFGPKQGANALFTYRFE